MRLGYGYERNQSHWWYFYIPGFLPINAYAWSGNDGHISNVRRGESLTVRRLILLRNHFRSTHRWFWRRFMVRSGYWK